MNYLEDYKQIHKYSNIKVNKRSIKIRKENNQEHGLLGDRYSQPTNQNRQPKKG